MITLFYPLSKSELTNSVNIKQYDKDIENLEPLLLKCENCMARNTCGSDCYVQLFENSLNDNLCEFKKYIFLISIYFCAQIEMTNYDIYCEVVNMANKIIDRLHQDEELNRLFLKCSHKYSFTKLKEIKDTDTKRYNRIIKKYST